MTVHHGAHWFVRDQFDVREHGARRRRRGAVINEHDVLICSFVLVAWGQRQAQPPPDAPMPKVLQNYQPVTAERLKRPEDGNWLMIRRTYDGWGYSPLDQITSANVTRLRPVWVFSTGETRAHESAPIINNGVLFVTTPMNQVIAIDAQSGNLLWRYRRPRPEAAS